MARYLLVGHVTRDLVPGAGFRYGGAVLYAGLTARRLGFETCVVTASAEKDLEVLFPELRFFQLPAPKTTTFENIYTPSGRKQLVHSLAPPIDISALPSSWLEADIVHLAPVLGEISPEGAQHFKTNFLVANPQGWFRRVLPGGEVAFREPDLSSCPKFKALVVSEEDLQGQRRLIEKLREKTEILVLTLGEKGAEFWRGEEYLFCPVEPKPERDATGAGDILAAAFFAALFTRENPKRALEFAACLAGFSVMREGLAGVPTFKEISLCEQRF